MRRGEKSIMKMVSNEINAIGEKGGFACLDDTHERYTWDQNKIQRL